MAFGYDLEFIRQRYNRLAAIYPVSELFFLLPLGIRAKGVQQLGLQLGDTVLEVGCGTGRNLRHLVKAVGSSGRVYGVDYSDGMLKRARQLCEQEGWDNVTLLQQDAAQLSLPGPVDGALFSLSYAVMSEPRQALAQAWSYLRPRKHLVIVDAKLVKGLLGRLWRPLVIVTMKATVLGDPDQRPWEDLKEFTSIIEMQEVSFGTYYILRGTKL